MTKLRKNIFTVLLSALFLFGVSGVAVNEIRSVKAEESASVFEMIGASVRTDDKYGIRFAAMADAVDATAKYYVMIVPYAWVDTEYNLAENNDYYNDFVTVGGKVVGTNIVVMESQPELQTDGEYAGKYLIKGTISSVKYNNLNQKFFGTVYKEDVDGNRTYAKDNGKGVRSMCWVAGKALNELPNTDPSVTALKVTVTKAYNKSLGNAEDGTQVEFNNSFYFAKNAYYSLAKGSVTSLLLKDVPTLDLPISYELVKNSTNYDFTSTITKDGIITVNDESGSFTANAYIAGNKQSLTIYPSPKMAPGELQNFSISHVNGKNWQMAAVATGWNQTLSNVETGNASEYLASFNDRSANKYVGYGVAKCTTTASYQEGGLCLNKSKEQLKEMDIKKIGVRLMVSDEVNNLTGSTPKIGIRLFNTSEYTSLIPNAWTIIYLTKQDLLTNDLLTGATDDEKWDSWCEMYCNSGIGTKGFTNYTDGAAGKVKSATFYIDTINVVETELKDNQLENFYSSATASNITGKSSFSIGLTGSQVASYPDKNGTRAFGLGKALMYYGDKCIAVRCSKTKQELLDIMENLDTLTIRLLVKYNPNTNPATTCNIKFFNVNNTVETNLWTELTVTKAQLLTTFTTADAFATKYCSTGSGGAANQFMLVSSLNSPYNLDVYIDYISYTTVQ